MSSKKECPLCISPMSQADEDFYPCPCGYQICPFCFDRISKEYQNLCPQCRAKYAKDAVNRVGPQFRPVLASKPPPEQIPVPTVFVLSSKMVQISGIPQKICSNSLLIRKEYLGQYGQIKKIATYSTEKNPFLKQTIRKTFRVGEPDLPSVYVQFSSESEALLCIYSLNNAIVYNKQITVMPALTEHCSNFLLGKECTVKGCMKMHGKIKPKELSFKEEEIDQNCDRFISALRIAKPAMYDSYPTRSFGVPVFPPPRLIPPENGNKNFIITSACSQSLEQPCIMSLAIHPNAIPMPWFPPASMKHGSSLVGILGLDHRV